MLHMCECACGCVWVCHCVIVRQAESAIPEAEAELAAARLQQKSLVAQLEAQVEVSESAGSAGN